MDLIRYRIRERSGDYNLIVSTRFRLRLQGVSFRYHTQKEANKLDLRGWCHNHPDSSVEGVAVGSPDNIKQFRLYLERGPSAAQVSGVELITEKQGASDAEIKEALGSGGGGFEIFLEAALAKPSVSRLECDAGFQKYWDKEATIDNALFNVRGISGVKKVTAFAGSLAKTSEITVPPSFDSTKGIIRFTYRRRLQPHLPTWIPVVGGWTAKEKIVNHDSVLHLRMSESGKRLVTKSGEVVDPEFNGLSGLVRLWVLRPILTLLFVTFADLVMWVNSFAPDAKKRQ
ncbi:MAG: hypothetical protein TREMPRED_002738 [Tremellales sp. Tagirdzhanova-0007]|nr:MAG: hypothetical protein TREMPRED_002738 [Tremellales sp. Tagirdzhanova-0007]